MDYQKVIDELIDKAIQEEWQDDIRMALKDILPHAKSTDEAIGALEQIMGELTDYQKQYALEIINSEKK